MSNEPVSDLNISDRQISLAELGELLAKQENPNQGNPVASADPVKNSAQYSRDFAEKQASKADALKQANKNVKRGQ